MRHLSKHEVRDGWSAPVIQSFEEFRLVDSGVCLVSRSDAEEAILELRSEKGTGRSPCHVQMLSATSGHVEADTALVVVEYTTALSPRCVEDGSDQIEVRNYTLAEETWSGMSGFSTAQIWRAKVSKGSRESSGEFVVLSRPRYRRVTRVQRRPASRRVRPTGSSAESESGWVDHPGSRPAQHGAWTSNRRVRLWEGCWRDLQSASRGAKLQCRHSCLAGPAQYVGHLRTGVVGGLPALLTVPWVGHQRRWPPVFGGFSIARSVSSIWHVHAVGGARQPMRCAHAVGGSSQPEEYRSRPL